MNMVPSEAAKYAASLAAAAKDAKVKVMIAPTFVCLPGVVEAVKGSNIIVSAQNVNDHEKGAYTGEVSCAMLKDIGVNSVILGHSERRQYYGETNEFINKKVLFALENGMEVDLCVGETLEEREGGRLEEVLTAQINVGLDGVTPEQMKHVTIAYEPVWAIGTGKTATAEQAQEIHAYIRKVLASKFGAKAENTPLLYGGSCKPSNAKELFAKEDVDGGLIGGAALVADDFLAIGKSF